MPDEVVLCGPESVEVPTDFVLQPGCGRRFLERIGALDASVGPLPRLAPGALKVHAYPLHPPLPAPEYQRFLHGDPLGDRGQTLDWPHPHPTVPPSP